MELDWIHQRTAFHALREEWEDLLERSVTRVPFLHHTFLSQWWDTLGGGEWAGGELWIALGREKGNLRGIAPLFMPQGSSEGMLLGSVEISDYLDILAAPEDVDTFVRCLLEELEENRVEGWSGLNLYNLPAASPTPGALKRAAEQLGWQYYEEGLAPCPGVALPADWETYLAGLDKKQRHEIRRKIRRGEEKGLRFRLAEDVDEFPHLLESMLDLMKRDERKEAFLTDAMQKHFRQSLLAAFKEGWLQLAVLEKEGNLAAAYLNFDEHDTLWVYNSALNPDYGALSAGWVLLGNIIQWAIEHRKKELDFMRGDERYKYRFGGVDRAILQVRVERS